MRIFSVSIGAGLALLLFGTVARGGEGEGTVQHKSWTEYAEGTESRSFTLERAILTALKQNPDILRAIQEIERTKGVIIQVRAEALPHINAQATLDWTDPNLSGRSTALTGTSSGAAAPVTPLVSAPESQVKDL